MILDFTAVDWAQWTIELGAGLEKYLASTASLLRSFDAISKATSIAFPSSQEEWRLTILAYIAEAAKRAYLNLEGGYDGLDLSRCAWAARNLLELRIWNRYVLVSSENARRFQEDSIIDEYEAHKAIAHFLRTRSVPDQDTRMESVHADIARIQEEWKSSNLKQTSKRLQMAVVSKEVGLEQQYKLWFKLLSKLVHPTSMLVCKKSQEQITKDLLRPVFVMGMESVFDIVNTITHSLGMEKHIRKWAELKRNQSADG